MDRVQRFSCPDSENQVSVGVESIKESTVALSSIRSLRAEM